jgi:L-fuconolactonase
MIVDAHHHLWDPAERDYPWMTGPVAPLRRRYGLDDVRAVTAEAGVSRTVVVQAGPDLGETTELLATAATSRGLIAGVVGWVDLTAPDLSDQLSQLQAAPGGDLLVGIRHQVHDEPDPEWLIRAEVIRGLGVLADRGLTYDLLVRTRELPAASRAAHTVEELSFVVDHGAKPPISSGEVEPWSSRLAELAALPNVTCKVSGLVTEADWTTWTPAQLSPYVDRLVELFGPRRLMFGSDWPVCTLAADYGQVLDAARSCLRGLSGTEWDAIFAGTAAATYRI